MAAAHAGPPSWLLVTLAAPHAWGLLPLLAPRAVCAVASALGYSDVPTPYTAGALVLAAAQAGAVFQWLYEWHAGQSALAREAAGGAPLLLRLVLAAPFLAGGAYLKLGAARALGRAGVGFARQLSGRVRTAPWCTAWPFSHTGAPFCSGLALHVPRRCGAAPAPRSTRGAPPSAPYGRELQSAHVYARRQRQRGHAPRTTSLYALGCECLLTCRNCCSLRP